MKIDIHTHTRKCKSGDAPTREISAKDFCQKVTTTDVKIIAITNHNVFDLTQYKEITTTLGEDTQVWPGVELDILDNEPRGHLLVIVSPKLAEVFSDAVTRLTTGHTPDSFTATIDEVLVVLDELNPIYVAHYGTKKPDISDAAIKKLEEKTKHPCRVLKEVSNSISAGIYISHGRPSIYGSDVHDWAKYVESSYELPDLRLPVDSFEHFCLLLEKDTTAINTVLNRKTSDDLTLDPFGDGCQLNLRVYNDINVIFGPKGTGKSCILKAIAKHYSENGADASVYESASDRLDELFNIKGRDLKLNLNPLGIHYCTDEIDELRKASEVGVTSLSKYVLHFAAKRTNKNAKRILLKDIELEEVSTSKREFSEFNKAVETTNDFLAFLAEDASVKKELSDEEHKEVTRILSSLLARLSDRKWLSFSGWKQIQLLNSAIEIFRSEVERKTGLPANPTTTGFRDYAINRIAVAINAAKIVKSIDTIISIQSEQVGSLGSDKGTLEFVTEFAFQKGDVTDSTFTSLTAVKKGTQKKFASRVRDILAHAFADDLFQYVSRLNEVEDVEEIKSVYELVLFRRYFAVDGQRYCPSSGEASMVMLHKELDADKEIYILDEPERSLGNEYISNVIVPLIKERAKAGRKIFISTHDANIAVRTLPYSSVYRCYEQLRYVTYLGNPFSNNLVNAADSNDQLDWKQISMRTLEGGKEAFGERGKIYGNV